MNPLQALLDAQGVILLDGGLATELEKRGSDLNHDLWSARLLLENPDPISELHYDYYQAGADVVITSSYQASLEGFGKFGLTETQAGRLIQKSVTLAVGARARFVSDKKDADNERLSPLVAASIGPYGAVLHNGSEYTGDYKMTREQLRDFHRPRMALLDDTDADLFAIETIPSQLEAEALLELLGEFPQRRAWLSFSCKNDQQICHGEVFADCAKMAAKRDQIVAVGINCSAPQIVLPLLQSVADVRIPLLAYPNSGEQYNSPDHSWTAPGSGHGPTDSAHLAELAAHWHGAGARLVGGCCGTSIDDISAMRKRLLTGRRHKGNKENGEVVTIGRAR